VIARTNEPQHNPVPASPKFAVSTRSRSPPPGPREGPIEGYLRAPIAPKANGCDRAARWPSPKEAVKAEATSCSFHILPGYLMHFLESRSHHVPTGAENVFCDMKGTQGVLTPDDLDAGNCL